jgi:hypothetical protein
VSDVLLPQKRLELIAKAFLFCNEPVTPQGLRERFKHETGVEPKPEEVKIVVDTWRRSER